MRRNLIVTYDIRDPKRLRHVYKTCRAYGNHLQYSVFECDLDPRERLRFEEELNSIIAKDEDQVIFIDLGPSSLRSEHIVSALGQTYAKFDPPCFVV